MLSQSRHKSLKDVVGRLLFPVLCRGCGLESDWLCRECVKSLKISERYQCVICKKAAKTGLCGKCQVKTGLDGIVAPLEYQNSTVKKLITDLKFNDNTQIIPFIVPVLAKKILQELPIGDWHYTFIPQSLERTRERGYNQSKLLAEALGETVFTGVSKIKETKSQVNLTKKERQKNLLHAFRVIGKAPAQIIICDDVVTTGSTLGQVAKALKRAGAKEVWAITIAHD